MIIRDVTVDLHNGVRSSTGLVVWEDCEYAPQILRFEVHDSGGATFDRSGDAFFTACFPLASLHRERRIRVEAPICPMLIEGLRTVHAWWDSWEISPVPLPEIEAPTQRSSSHSGGARRASGFLSGGVDGLHMLWRNRRLYDEADPAYIRDAFFVHGFDIGKRARDPQTDRYEMILKRLSPIAAEMGVRLVSCKTNLRYLPTQANYWVERYYGAALAAVGHAATIGSTLVFIAATNNIAGATPLGSHPAVDHHFSSQRVSILHDGSRFSRLRKVRDLATWPTALDNLRVCGEASANILNCGKCEKCVRTRLQLLAVGCDHTAAFGASRMPADLLEQIIEIDSTREQCLYEDLLAPLEARGLDDICGLLRAKIDRFYNSPLMA